MANSAKKYAWYCQSRMKTRRSLAICLLKKNYTDNKQCVYGIYCCGDLWLSTYDKEFVLIDPLVAVRVEHVERYPETRRRL